MHGHSTLFSNVKSLIFQWKYLQTKIIRKDKMHIINFNAKQRSVIDICCLSDFWKLESRLKCHHNYQWFPKNNSMEFWNDFGIYFVFSRICIQIKNQLYPFGSQSCQHLFSILKNNATSKTSLRKIFSFSLRMYVIV